MIHSPFVHLHNHTEYSLLDGACCVSGLVARAASEKMPALAITDHGNLFGAIKFYQEAMKAGIKPIIGCEVYVAPQSRFEKTAVSASAASHHLTLLARNEEGYQNLMKLTTAGFLEGFYYRPRVDKQLLGKHCEGLIALSGCLKGEIPQLLKDNQVREASEVAGQYQELFGGENFFLEIGKQNIEEQAKINAGLLQLARSLKIPIVATNDCHYLDRDDAEIQDILICIQTGKTVDDPGRMKFSTDEFYFRSADEMKALFSELPQAVSATIEIAERCNLDLVFGKNKFPDFKLLPSFTLNSYLKKLCYDGLKVYSPERGIALEERLQHELKVIEAAGYASYFLIVWDLVHYARQKGISVGPGRGSAGGSLVAYLLGITEVDPLRYGLLFERFLNLGRLKPPDIDIDFEYERRNEVIDYLRMKYGDDRVAQIITFGTMAAKAAVRDVGRALNMPYTEVDKIAKLIPNELNITLLQAMQKEPELKSLADSDARVARLLTLARRLEGFVRHASTHAAGVVISQGPLTNLAPLFKATNSEVTTQYDMDSLADIGLLKLDILGLRTLTVINDTLRILKSTRRGELNLKQIPLDDKKTFQLLSKAQSLGVFQLESSGMQDLLKRLSVTKFDDIIATIALHRPGPIGGGMIDEFISGKKGRSLLRYDHPALKPILKDTYGVILYQEQIMKIVSKLAGFTLEQSDILQQAIGKKIPQVIDEQRQAFIAGAAENKVEKQVAEKVFDLISRFAGYGFNKAHATAYALIAYQTAYLKANYTIEFMAALLTSEMGNTDKITTYINECRRIGIKVLPPDVNESQLYFTVVGNDIRCGLATVKNAGREAIRSIINARERKGKFTSFHQFYREVDLRLVNKRVVESLIKCGSFDSLGIYRSRLYASLGQVIALTQDEQKAREKGQISLFSTEESSFDNFEDFLEIPEWPEEKLLSMEKEMLGFYVTSHPLARYDNLIKRYTSRTGANGNGREVTVGGIIVNLKKITTKKNGQMAIFNLESTNGTVRVVAFPLAFEKFSPFIQADGMVFVKGKIDAREERPQVNADEIIPVSIADEALAGSAHIKLSERVLSEKQLCALKETLLSHFGDCPIYLHLLTENKKEVVVLTDSRCKPTQSLLTSVEELIGKETLTFSA